MVLVSTREQEPHGVGGEVVERKMMLVEHILSNKLSEVSLQLSKRWRE